MIILRKQATNTATIITSAGRCIGVAETVSGTLNGVNQVFYTSYDYEPGAISLLYNGQSLHSPDDFTETGSNEITLLYVVPTTVDILRATYAYDECLDADSTTLLDLTDTPSVYDSGKYLRSTSSGVEWATVSGGTGTSDHSELNGLDYASAGHTGFQPAGIYEFPRYYIESDVTVLVNNFGQYVIEETRQIEVAGTLEFGSNGGMLIIK